MKRTFEEAIPLIKDWYENDRVGLLLSHKGRSLNPRKTAQHYVEVYSKRDELDAVVVEACDWLLAKIGAFKVEVVSSEGKMNKVKITRQL